MITDGRSRSLPSRQATARAAVRVTVCQSIKKIGFKFEPGLHSCITKIVLLYCLCGKEDGETHVGFGTRKLRR
jgi:hypothetical protein